MLLERRVGCFDVALKHPYLFFLVSSEVGQKLVDGFVFDHRRYDYTAAYLLIRTSAIQPLLSWLKRFSDTWASVNIK